MTQQPDQLLQEECARLQWVVHHLSRFEFVEAHELGWRGKQNDPTALTRAEADLVAVQVQQAERECARLALIAQDLQNHELAKARQDGWLGT